MYRLFTAQLPPGDTRREREQSAVRGLLVEAFGPGAQLGHTPEGAPYIIGVGDVHISISHCADMAVLVVSDRPIGVDVETLRPQLRKVASRFLSPEEALRNPDLPTLMALWTIKEAVYKAALTPGLPLTSITTNPAMTEATAGQMRFGLDVTVEPDRALTVAYFL